MQFSQQHVVITGGSEGIGLALAREFVRAGAHVSLMARGQAKLEAAASELQAVADGCASSSKIRTFSMDTTVFEQVPVGAYRISHPYIVRILSTQVTSAMKAAQASLGPIDILVCCAGSAVPGLRLSRRPLSPHPQNAFPLDDCTHFQATSTSKDYLCLKG